MKILWVGWGDLGHRAVGGLVAAGHEVVALRRSPVEHPPPGVHPLVGDLASPSGLHLPSGIGACIITLTPDVRDRAGYEAAYGAAVHNLYSLLEGDIRATLPRPGDEGIRVVFASSTAVYGQDGGEWVNETSSTSPSRFNGAVMRDTEQFVTTHDGTRGVVARLGGIYGPGRDRLVRATEQGRPASRKWTNRIHADDAARALVHLATSPTPMVPDVVNIVDTQPARKHEVVAFIAGELGIAPPPLDDDTHLGKRVDGSRLLTTGFTHEFPTHREGYRDVLAHRHG